MKAAAAAEQQEEQENKEVQPRRDQQFVIVIMCDAIIPISIKCIILYITVYIVNYFYNV